MINLPIVRLNNNSNDTLEISNVKELKIVEWFVETMIDLNEK